MFKVALELYKGLEMLHNKKSQITVLSDYFGVSIRDWSITEVLL